MLFFRRLLPSVVGLVVLGLFWWQSFSATLYPWLALCAATVFAFAAWSTAWKRVPMLSWIARMSVPLLLLLSLGYALLLAEGALGRWVIPIVAGGASYAALELLFLHAFLPTRYPVNGLSHLNLALVPLVLWCVQSASVGLVMFVHAPRWLPVLVMGGVCAALFWATAHAEADQSHQLRWSAVGAVVGAHVGLLGAILPIDMTLHGAYAAALGAFGMRARRYGISPRLPRSFAWVEASAIAVLLVALLATARWA